MRSTRTKIPSAILAAALLISPTMAAASTMSVSAQPAPGGWTTLSQLTPAGATALASTGVNAGAPNAATMAGVAAVQSNDAAGANPFPLPVIAVLLAVLGVAIYIAFIEKHHHHLRPFVISPA